MTNRQDHEFPDGPPMPEMCEGLLSPDDIHALFTDLANCTTVVSIQEKGNALAHSSSAPSSLPDARERLISGNTRALQIRYRYDDHEWTDTLMAVPGGVRLIRCQHPTSLQPATQSAPESGPRP